MQNGGSVKGFRSSSEELKRQMTEALLKIADPHRFKQRYGSAHPFYIAVGDGNHSLAAAKSLWAPAASLCSSLAKPRLA